MKLPQHWHIFIKAFQNKFETEIVYDIVRVFQDKEVIEECYTTYEFEEYFPNYFPVADDSGGQVALISKDENDTKVYLTSYGTLIEADFEILDRNLLHCMDRKFPFEVENNKNILNLPNAELYITDIGSNKMKIVSMLKEKFNLSGTETLQLSKQDRILYHKGTYRWMAPSIQQLEKLGATVEIVMI